MTEAKAEIKTESKTKKTKRASSSTKTEKGKKAKKDPSKRLRKAVETALDRIVLFSSINIEDVDDEDVDVMGFLRDNRPVNDTFDFVIGYALTNGYLDSPSTANEELLLDALNSEKPLLTNCTAADYYDSIWEEAVDAIRSIFSQMRGV